jgi:amidohydrolase
MRKLISAAVLGLMMFNLSAQSPQQLDKEISLIKDKLVEWRRHFHENPELSNREFKTSLFISDYLKTLGLEVKTGIAKTGVLAILKGGKPGPVIALRADIDALPVIERVNIPFASKVKTEYNGQQVGVMHACGHDSHTAMLMGVATVLSKMQKEVAGTIKFIFQPAEEGAPEGEEGGASLMVKEGVLDNPKVDVIFGLHIESNIEVGHIQYKPGAFMASADAFTIKVKGKSSHGSQPWLGVDPVVTSSLIIQGLQTIVSRQEDLTKAPVVITVGAINGGVRFNIIPEEVKMIGTIRTLDSAMRLTVLDKIKHTAETIAESQGAVAEFSYENKTLVTFNTPILVEKMVPVLQRAIGKENVKQMNWVTGAEDFSFYGTKVPSFFFYLGGMPKGNDPAKAPPHHTPDFYIDDSRLDAGVKAFCQLVFDYPGSK